MKKLIAHLGIFASGMAAGYVLFRAIGHREVFAFRFEMTPVHMSSLWGEAVSYTSIALLAGLVLHRGFSKKRNRRDD